MVPQLPDEAESKIGKGQRQHLLDRQAQLIRHQSGSGDDQGHNAQPDYLQCREAGLEVGVLGTG